LVTPGERKDRTRPLTIVVSHSEGPPWRGDSMVATENAGFGAKVQRNLGLDFLTKQHKSLQKLQPVYRLV